MRREHPKEVRDQVISMYFNELLSAEKIAKRLDIPAGTVKDWIHKGRSDPCTGLSHGFISFLSRYVRAGYTDQEVSAKLREAYGDEDGTPSSTGDVTRIRRGLGLLSRGGHAGRTLRRRRRRLAEGKSRKRKFCDHCSKPLRGESFVSYYHNDFHNVVFRFCDVEEMATWEQKLEE